MTDLLGALKIKIKITTSCHIAYIGSKPEK